MLNSKSTNSAFYNNFIQKIDDLEKLIDNQTITYNKDANGSISPYRSSLEILNSSKVDSLNSFLNSKIQLLLDKYFNPLIKSVGIKNEIIIDKSKLGTKVEFDGDSGHIYNLLSDNKLYFNGLYENTIYSSKYKKNIAKKSPVLSETAFTVLGMGGINTVSFNHEGIAKVDKFSIKNNLPITLADGGQVTLKGKALKITTNRGYSITQIAKLNEQVEVFIKADDKMLKERFPGGLMGYKLKSGEIPLTIKEINPRLFAIKFELPYLVPKYFKMK